MRIQHNIMAMNAYRNYTNNTSALSKNLEKLSSGYKINRAGDDAAGLAISEKMRAQITGLEVAQKNAKDGISLVQTAEGALTEVHDMLNRMYELAEQSANGTYDDDVDRYQLQKEIDSLSTEINRIADSANFNGIKLLDGSLSTASLTAGGVTTSTIDMAKGVEVTQGTNGGGTKGEFSINLTNAFGAGDKLDVTTLGKDAKTVSLTYGTHFSGDTIEKQAQSIAQALSSDAAISSNFTVEVDGSTIKLTSLVEGSNTTDAAKDDYTAVVSAVTVDDKSAVEDATWAATPGVKNDDDGAVKFEKLFDSTTDASAMDVKEGDELTFEVTLTDGKKMTASLTVTKDMIGGTTGQTLTNFVNALNSNKAKFADAEDTVLDESKIKFSDLFTASADAAGGLKLENNTSSVGVGTAVKIINTTTGKSVTSATDTAVDSTGIASNKYVIALNTSGNADDFSLGDKLTIQGKLADGRTYEVEVVAGKDFKIGATHGATMDNLEALLETKGVDVKVKDGAKEEIVSSTEIFGGDKEIDFTAASGTFESKRAGAKFVSTVSEVKLETAGKTEVSTNLKNGEQKTSADSVISFSAGVEYGATIEVDGKKYEIVKDAADVSSAKNVAVVVDDLSKPGNVAKAMEQSLKGELDDSVYKVTSSGSKVTVSTVDVGSEAKAVSVGSSGDKAKQLQFTLDPAKIKAGSAVTINGQKYEFVEKGSSPSASGATAVEVDSFEKATAASLGSALAAAADGVNDAMVQVDADGQVTVRGLENKEGKLVDPTVKFENGKGGLTLQIGDTAEDFNKLNVSIFNMHTADMGIGGIDISKQDGGADAMAKIKDAINYVSDVRGTLGATQNRLDHTINNLSVMQENIQDAEATIRDVDVAKEMMEYTKNNILVQSAQAMLAQANQVPQGVLQLLQ